ncbi:MAG: hypothetical protein ACI9TV_001061 [Sulfurimonas sp.]|jgi:hypothetical protein|uniref:hypothetical protein n=1 Tax=Sulfurimonas sp. TaxID=2022749 RepID=UPI0039E6D880
MKLSALFLTLSLVAALNANQTVFQKYTQLKNNSELAKIEAKRNLILQKRDHHEEIRDYRDVKRDMRQKALYVRMENSFTPYR